MASSGIENLTDIECEALIEELKELDPNVDKKVKYLLSKNNTLNIQTALEYVVNETVQLWAKVHINWTARDYQIPILEQGKKSKRLVLRLGRRLGKCLDEDSEVTDMNTGMSYKVKDIVKNKTEFAPVSLNNNLQQSKKNKYSICPNGVQKTYQLKTTGGYDVVATDNHPFLTINGWKELKDLKANDYIATINKLNIEPYKDLELEEIIFLAYMIGDGSCVDRLYFHNENEIITAEMNEALKIYNCSLKTYKNRGRYDYVVISNDNKENKAITAINKHGLRGRYSHNKFVPADVYGLSNDKIAIFLNRLFSTDGCISTIKENKKRQTVSIRYSSTSERLIKDIRMLLMRFGIKSHVGKYSNLTPDKKKGRDIYVLSIKRLDSIKIFLEEIGMVRDIEKQQKLLNYCLSNWNDKYSKIPGGILNYIEEVCNENDINYRELMLCCGLRLEHLRKRPNVVQKKIIENVANELEDEYLLHIVSSNIHWDKVKSIEYAGERNTYDLSVECDRNFLCGQGIVTHNTEDMCILILWHMFRQPNAVHNDPTFTYNTLILTPYETQIDLIFDRLNQLIDCSETLKSITPRRIHHRIEFSNNGAIIGLTLGVGTGKEGSNTRGQKASYLVYDEVDYAGSKEITNTLNIANEDPGRIKVIASSTPSGKHEEFYNWCVNASTILSPKKEDIENFKFTGYVEEKKKGNGWTQIYSPSTVNKTILDTNPETGQTYLQDIKDELTEMRFEQEVMANFGDEELGVYRKEFIDKALEMGEKKNIKYFDELNDDEKMEFFQNRHNYILIAAVDWDIVQATPNILCLMYDKKDKDCFFAPFFRVEIPKSTFTLTDAVNTLVELHERFRFDHIAVDRGYGETQLETIKKYGVDHPRTKLHLITEGFHFGTTLDVRDPHTGKKIKKHFKPFLVDNSVLVFEKNKIALNPRDKVLLRQLTSYRIKSISQSGKPIFSSNDEHSVDTLNMCLLMFSMKYDSLFKSILKGVVKKTNITRSIEEEWASRDLKSAIDELTPIGLTKDHRIIYSTVSSNNINRKRKNTYKRSKF